MDQNSQRFRQGVIQKLAKLKYGLGSSTEKPQFIYIPDAPVIMLDPITAFNVFDPEVIKTLAEWREKVQPYFPSQFQVTLEGTRGWLENQVIKLFDRILFFVRDVGRTNAPIGHVGLYRFNWEEESCEIDNIVRGQDNLFPGVMKLAIESLDGWAFNKLGVKILYLKVLADNERAIKLYERCGFKKFKLIPLRREEKPNMVQWEEDLTLEKAERYFLQMRLDAPN